MSKKSMINSPENLNLSLPETNSWKNGERDQWSTVPPFNFFQITIEINFRDIFHINGYMESVLAYITE